MARNDMTPGRGRSNEVPLADGPGGHPLEVGTQNLYVADDEDGECVPIRPQNTEVKCGCGMWYAAELFPGCPRCL